MYETRAPIYAKNFLHVCCFRFMGLVREYKENEKRFPLFGYLGFVFMI